MNWCLLFRSIGSSGAPPMSLSHWGSLSKLLQLYAPMLRRIVRCWRPRGQNLTVSFHKTVGWTAADPSSSVHQELLHWSWCVTVLFKCDHWIDRRFLSMDRRFIRRWCLRGFSSSIHPAQLGYRPLDHPTVSSWFQLLRNVPTTPTLCTDGTVGSSDSVNFLPFLPRFWPLKNILSSHFGMWYFCIHGT
jgi:hypothetical protein